MWLLTLHSVGWICAVWYCAELNFAQYDTARNLTQRSLILRRAFTTHFNDWLCAVWYYAELDSSQDEKNWGSKILLDCPFKAISEQRFSLHMRKSETQTLIPRSDVLSTRPIGWLWPPPPPVYYQQNPRNNLRSSLTVCFVLPENEHAIVCSHGCFLQSCIRNSF